MCSLPIKRLLTCLYLLPVICCAGKSPNGPGAYWLPQRLCIGYFLQQQEPFAAPYHQAGRWTQRYGSAREAASERRLVQALTQRTRLQQLEAHRLRQYLGGLGGLLLVLAGGLLALGTRYRRLQSQHIELAATHAEQNKLYCLIGHDLRSPVLAFSGLADLLTTYVERQDTARLLGLGGRVRQAADGLRELLDNLLNWALSQRGELLPVLEAVPVASLLVELGRLYQPTADLAGVDLLLATTTPSQVLADRQMTLAILRNLVSNALNATPAGGRITVRAMATGTHWLLEVADTGQGINAEDLAHLLAGSLRPLTPRYHGRAGLGLRLSHSFAQAQGGQLALYSTLGQGTTATLILPCSPPSTATSPD